MLEGFVINVFTLYFDMSYFCTITAVTIMTMFMHGYSNIWLLLAVLLLTCIAAIQIYWFGPLLGGIAGAKLYDVVFVNSSTVLQLLKARVEHVVERFSRPSGNTARSEEVPGEQWSTTIREDGGLWRQNSLYRSRSLLVDRAVQSELVTKDVAENCLALTADAVNQRRSPDEATPTFSRGSVRSLNGDVVVEEGMVQRRYSYQQAIMHTDSLSQPTDIETEPAAAPAAVEEIYQSTLDTVSELEKPEVNVTVKESGFLAETADKKDEANHDVEADLDKIMECEKEAERKDSSSTRADILDSGSDEFDVTVAEQPPTAHQTEISRSCSASIEDENTASDLCDAENSHLAVASASGDLEDPCLPDASLSLPEHELEDVVWIRQTASDIQPPETTTSELKQSDRKTQERDSSARVLPTLQQSENGNSITAKLASSPPPLPPIDVIAIDVTGRPLSDYLPQNLEKDQCDTKKSAMSGSRNLQDSRLPDGSSSPSEHEMEDIVWISRAASDIKPADTTANELKQPGRDGQEHDSSTRVLPTVDQSKDGRASTSELRPSPPPPPPVDAIAVDITGQPLSDDLPPDAEEERSIVDDEYCHSPLGGAMPESEDSDAAEFAFP